MPLLLPISCAWLVSFWVGLSRLVLFARKGCEGRGKVGGRVGVARAVHVVVCVDWLVWWVFCVLFCRGRDSFYFFEGGCVVSLRSPGSYRHLFLFYRKRRGFFVSLIIRDATTTSENASLVFSRFRLPKHTVANSISFVLFQLRPSLRVTRSFRPGCPLALDLLFALG